MEELGKTRIKVSPFFSLLLFLIHFISSSSSSYVVPNKYFINCGSNRNVNQAGRSFTGDENRGSSVVFTKQSTSVASSDQSASDIYGSARIFTQQSSYAFETSDPNPSSIYIVRLHFLALRSSSYDLYSANFDVSTSSGFLLLAGFSGKEIAETPLVKEFFVTVNSTRFRIYLTPRGSSIAFLNAVEFFPAPPVEFGVEKNRGQIFFDSPPVLQTIHRINIGGGKIEPENDNMWRNWNSDDAYLQNNDSSTTAQPFSGRLNYSPEDSRFAAPDLVYETARTMKKSVTSRSKIYWSFSVNKTSRHVVRAHFCDIISVNKDTLYFNFYINDAVKMGNYTIPELAQPEYSDFNVSAETSGTLRISIGPSTINEQLGAILNGLEILEIKEGSASVPVERDIAKSNLAMKPVVVVGSVIGGLAILVSLAAVFFVAAKRRRRNKSREEGSAEKSSWGQVAAVFGGGNSNSRVTEQTISGSPVSNLHLGLRISLSEIHFATRRFSPKLVIGRGGFGSVYKGTLHNGTRVAVKRSSGRESGQGLDEFQTEITVLSSIRHRHLVSLIGYCDEREEMILVYEFMENGTLREHLYGSSSPDHLKPCLSWKQRLEICIGSASGLNYLHKGSSGRIIHRDVKSTNILLDENMVAKVADFGLSKAGLPEEAETHVSTVVKGTMGYLDPEYCQTNQLTEKSDVYSFGVVLLEILCARPPIDTTLPKEQINLACWAMKCKSEGALIQAVDPAIRGEINANSLRKFGETAEKCLHTEGPERPAMGDVIWELEYALQLQRTPAPREPHEDSTAATASGFSAALVLPDSAQIPDFEDQSGTDTADFSEMSASDVFSLLRRDTAR